MNISEKLIQIAENEQKVYDAGYKEGYDTGKAEGGLDNATLSSLIDGSIAELNIPEGTAQIKVYAFYKCKDMTKVNIPGTVKSIGGYAFYGCSSLESVVIPDSVDSLGGSVFHDCSSLVNVSIGNGVKTLGHSVFSGCTSLESITLSDSITLVQNSAFYNCSNLKKVVFGSGIRTIEANSFSKSTKVVEYNFSKSIKVPELTSTNGIIVSAATKILVPNHLYNDWIVATNWSYHKDYIVAADVKAEPDQSKFNIYVDATTLKEIVDYNFLGVKLGYGIGENFVKTEGNMTYLRIHGDGTSNEAYAIVQNVSKQKTGKYLVYAYRLPTSNKTSQHYFQVYANTTNDTPSGQGDMFYVKTQKDGKWHVDIIDIEAAINSSYSVVVDKNTSKFTPSNGEYITQKLRFDWFNERTPTDEYIDIAYIGLCDSLDLARAADPDYTGIEFSPEYFASKLSCEINTTERGMKYATVSATTNSNGESWIWLSENSSDYRIIPNTTRYVGVLYKDAPIRTNGNGAWGEIYACSANNSLTNSSWYSLGRIDPYDTSSGWHFGIVKFKAPLADAACRLMRFDFFNGLTANTIYTMDIAFVKCFASEDEANTYYQSYKARYNI